MDQLGWKSMGSKKQKAFSHIMYLPRYHSKIILERRGVFLSFGKCMVRAGKWSAENLKIIQDIFIAWDKAPYKPKKFVLDNLNLEQVNLLLELWEMFDKYTKTLTQKQALM